MTYDSQVHTTLLIAKQQQHEMTSMLSNLNVRGAAIAATTHLSSASSSNHHQHQQKRVPYTSATAIHSTTSNNSSNDNDDNPHTTKGNDGSSPYQKQRRICRIATYVIISLGLYQLVFTHFIAGLVPDIEIDPTTGRKRVRRRPELSQKLLPDGRVVQRSPVDGVIEGHLHLIDIILPPYEGGDAVAYNKALFADGQYHVKGVFCALEWSQQAEHPASVPVFDDLIQQSTMCAVTKHTADLYSVTKEARKWDVHFRNITLHKRIQKREKLRHLPQPEAEPMERSIPPTALIFHESRCGSTLVSNILASLTRTADSAAQTEDDTAPLSSRVYSEAAPPMKALEACPASAALSAQGGCDVLLHHQLIRDVFYMMGRTQLRQRAIQTKGGRSHDNHYLFYKLQARAVHYLPLLEAAFDPDPLPAWVYLYRDNIHVMQSQFTGSVVDPKSEERNVLGQKKAPKCLDGYPDPNDAQNNNNNDEENEPKAPAQQQYELSPKSSVQKLVLQKGRRSVDSLKKEEYCAANLVRTQTVLYFIVLYCIVSLSLSFFGPFLDFFCVLTHLPFILLLLFNYSQASLSESAIRFYDEQAQKSQPNFFVNYKQLPDAIWDHVLPKLGVELRAKDIHRMEKVAAVYAQGRTGGAGNQNVKKGKQVKVFVGDNEDKEANVPFAIAQAAHDFMDATYDTLEALSKETFEKS